MLRTLLFLLLLPALPQAWAHNAAQVRSEVQALLGWVEQGGCSFMRNGSWHSSAEARKLLEHKFDEAMRDPGSMPSTEHFIAKLASRSSMSGKPYWVRCGDAKLVESGPWLLGKLAELRLTADKPAANKPAAHPPSR